MRAPALFVAGRVAALPLPVGLHRIELPALAGAADPLAGHVLDPNLWDFGQLARLGDLQENDGLRLHILRAMESMESRLKSARDPRYQRRDAQWQDADQKFFRSQHALTEDWRHCYWLFADNALPLTCCGDCSMPKGLRGRDVRLPHCQSVRALIRIGGHSAYVKHSNPFPFNICPVC